jgi:hypothetical protein
VSGKDPAADYRGKYSDLKGALAVIKACGSMADVLDKHYARIDVAFAQRGDVVMLESEMAVGVLWAGEIWTADEIGGISLARSDVTAAWRVE